MSAWGHGPFDNDDAGDWLLELDDHPNPTELARSTLRVAVAEAGYLEVTEGFAAVAAAAWLAGLATESPRPQATAADRALAVAALQRTLEDDSEARDLWIDAESLDAFDATVNDLVQRLREA